MNGKHDCGLKHSEMWHRLCNALVAAISVLLFSVSAAADGKQPKPSKLEGVVSAVDKARVTILDKDARAVELKCEEDFTDKVAIGSRVMAWYHVKEGVPTLHLLEYPAESTFVQPREFLPRIKKVIILPNSAVDGGEVFVAATANFLESKFGWYVAPPFLAEEIRRRAEASTSALEAIDSATGQVDLDRYLRAHRDLIRRLAEETRVDGVLEVDVELVQANFRDQIARWDGAKQPIAGAGSRLLTTLNLIPVGGHVPATTIAMKLWDSQANLLWRNCRGFAVLALQVGMGNKFRDRPLTEALKEEASVQEWFSKFFSAWLPADTRSAPNKAARP